MKILPVVEEKMEIFFFLWVDFDRQIRILVEVTDFDLVADKAVTNFTNMYTRTVVLNLFEPVAH